MTDLHDFRPDYGDVWDSIQRAKEDDYVEHLHALAQERNDRLNEHRPARPDPKPARRVKRQDAPRPGVEWKLAVLDRDQGCVYHANPADCSEGFYAHHVAPQQLLRRERPDALWNPLSGVGLCGKAHRQYHSGHITLSQDQLPAAVTAYVRSIGLGWYLDRHYEIPL